MPPTDFLQLASKNPHLHSTESHLMPPTYLPISHIAQLEVSGFLREKIW